MEERQSDVTLTPLEYKVLEAFRRIARGRPGEWITTGTVASEANKLGELTKVSGQLSSTLKRLARKGLIRRPETSGPTPRSVSGYRYRLLESEEEGND
jgi:DNA-binding MarR family transcriptional regulator